MGRTIRVYDDVCRETKRIVVGDVYEASASNPFAGVDVGARSKPASGDVDGDGLIDLVAGAGAGGLTWYRNAGAFGAPTFVERTDDGDPFAGVAADGWSAPALSNPDGDGIVDLVPGGAGGAPRLFSPEIERVAERAPGAGGTETGRARAETASGEGGASTSTIYVYDVNGKLTNRVDTLDTDGDGTADTILVYRVDGSGRETGFTVRTIGYSASSHDPFAGVDVGARSKPAMGDVDGDGTIDLVAGAGDGSLTWYRNAGSAGAPTFEAQTGEGADPFSDMNVGTESAPALGDVDGDGLIDLVVGRYDKGSLSYYRNTGAVGAPAFTLQTGDDDPFSDVEVNHLRGAPALADVDGDGDLDLLVGSAAGFMEYYRNVGRSGAAAFERRTGSDDPFHVVDEEGERIRIDVGNAAIPALGDVDGDGDLDLVVGAEDGVLNHYENVGSSTNPTFVERDGGDDPFAGIAADGWSAPALSDMDGDGVVDLVLGDGNGALRRFSPKIEKIVDYIFDADGDESADGTVTWILDANGGRIGYREDENGDGVDERTVTFTFDLDGRKIGSVRTEVFDADGDGVDERTEARIFDGRDRETGLVRTDAVDTDDDGVVDRTEVRTFDASGKLTAREDWENADDDGLRKPFGNAERIGTVDRILTYRVDETGRELGYVTDFRYEAVASDLNLFRNVAVDEGAFLRIGVPTLGDADGDGDLDLVVGGNGGLLNYYENTGTSAAPKFAGRAEGGADPFRGVDVGYDAAPAFADLDGDGDPDLVVGRQDGTLLYYENETPTPTVDAPKPTPAFVERTGSLNLFDGLDFGYDSAPAFADLDGDGDLDLVVGNEDGVLDWRRNSGRTTQPAFDADEEEFNPFEGFKAPYNARPALADVDGDGLVDLVLGGANTEYLSHFGNTGTVAAPTFSRSPGLFDFDRSGAHALGFLSAPVLADIDGDGVLDLLTGNSSGSVGYFTRPTGTVSRYVFDEDGVPTGRVDAHDTDGDGTADRIVTWTLDANGGEIGYREDADGDGTDDRTVTWTFDADGERTGSVRVDVFDADGDGIADRTETRTFDATDRLTARTDVEDRDGDGEPDTVVTHDVDGNGRETGFTTHAIGSAYAEGGADPFAAVDAGADSRPVPADLNGDGLVDLVVAESDGSLTWHENTGTILKPAFTARTGADDTFLLLVDGVRTAIDAGEVGLPALVDLDGDGDLDLVAGERDGALRHYENVGTPAAPTFVERVGRGVNPFHDVAASASSAFAFGDVDGDGDLDLAIMEAFGTGSPAWYENTGTASAPTFAKRTGVDNPFIGVDASLGASPVLADVDGDGLLDFVSGKASGSLIHYRNAGTASAPAFVKRTGEADPLDGVDADRNAATALADVDGDGVPDLAVGGENGDIRRFTRLEVLEAATWIFDDHGERVGYTADTDGDGIDDRTVTFTFDGDGRRFGSVRVDTFDTDGDGTDDRQETRTFDGHGRETGLVRTDIFDTDGDGVHDRVDVRTFDGHGRETGLVRTDLFHHDDRLQSLDRIEIRTFDESGGLTGRTDWENADGDRVFKGIEQQVGLEYGPKFRFGTVDRVLTYRMDETGRALGHVVDFRYEAAPSGLNPFRDVDVGTGRWKEAAPALGDVDGDGDLDLVMGSDDGDLQHYENTGTAAAPTFVERAGRGVNPFHGVDVGKNSAPAFADVDGDGDLDLVVGNFEGTLHYYENETSAPTSKTPKPSLAFAERTGSLNPFDDIDTGYLSAPAFADVDGDGDLDLVTGNENLALSWYRNTGRATKPEFDAHEEKNNPFESVFTTYYSRPALADVDGDGLFDVVLGGANFQSLNHFRNTGTAATPAFARHPSLFDFGGFSSGVLGYGHALALADLDDDGVLDLLVGNHYGSVAYFTRPTRTVVTYTFDESGRRNGRREDTDDDGDAERIVTHTFDGSDGRIGSIDEEDRDNDGIFDRIVTRTFDGSGDLTGRVDKEDRDNDGTADRIVTYAVEDGREVGHRVVEQDHVPGFPDPFVGIDVGDGASPALGDVDGDGLMDLVVGDSDGALNWYRNVGSAASPTFEPRTGTANPFAGVDVGRGASPALGDLDGDSLIDLIVGNEGGVLRWYRNAGAVGTPTFERRTGDDDPFRNVDVSRNNVAPVLGDVDGDGDLDLAVGSNDGYLVWYENTGSAAAPAFAERGGDNPFRNVDVDVGARSTPALADVDGDGDLDLVVGNKNGVLRYYENATPAAAAGTANPAPAFVERVGHGNPFVNLDAGANAAPAFADLDGDGTPDLVVGGKDGRLRYFENPAETVVEYTFDARGVRTGHTTTDVVDEDGDGVAELVSVRAHDLAGRPTGRVDTRDVDGDGAADRITFRLDGSGREIGHAIDFGHAPGSPDPFVGVDKAFFSKPALGDVDGDGDLDLVVGEYLGPASRFTGEKIGFLSYYENTGQTDAPTFTERSGAANPFAGIDAGLFNGPVLADLDGDGDLDLVLGGRDGFLRYHRNDGPSDGTSNPSPAFVALAGADNPFRILVDGIRVAIHAGERSKPEFGDLDGDGDLDLVVGNGDGALKYYRNDTPAPSAGTARPKLAFTALAGSDDPFAGIDVDGDAAPALADLDGDGDLDLAVGAGSGPLDPTSRERNGVLKWYENVGGPVAPEFEERVGVDNPFFVSVLAPVGGDPVLIDVGNYGTPEFGDVDGDGVLDLVVGEGDGAVGYFRRPPRTTVTYTFDENLGRTGSEEDTDGDGLVDRIVAFDFDDDGGRLGHVRIDLLDRNDDGPLDTTATHAFDETGRKTGHAIDNFAFAKVSAADDPFGHIAAGAVASPVLADVDGDGLIDLTVGDRNGYLNWHRNTGTTAAPVFSARVGAANPFDAIDADPDGKPVLADLDGDGLIDLVVGDRNGYLNWYRNKGTVAAPEFERRTDFGNPFSDVGAGVGAKPVLADVDGDGDLDLVVGVGGDGSTPGRENGGGLRYFENTNPSLVFVERVGAANPFADVAAGPRAAPAFADLDGDGDLDLTVGGEDGRLTHYRNDTPEAADGAANPPLSFVARDRGETFGSDPFAGLDAGERSVPTFADVDGDGTLDLVVGNASGFVEYFKRPVGTTVTWIFDDDGERIGHTEDTDGNGTADRTVTWTFDRFGNGTGRIQVDAADADGDGAPDGTETRTFDANGLPTGRVDVFDANGDGNADRIVTWTFDENGRAIGQATDTGGAADEIVVFIFDADGRKTGHSTDTDGDGNADETVVFTFDADGNGRVETRTEDSDDPSVARIVTRTFNGAGKLIAAVGEEDRDGDGTADGFLTWIVGGDGREIGYRMYSSSGYEAATEPVGNVDVGKYSSPAPGDLNGDGLIDLLMKDGDGFLNWHRKTERSEAPTFDPPTGIAGPFGDVDLSDGDAFALEDLDDDGDLDLVVGKTGGGLDYYRNMGTKTSPAFVLQVGLASPFSGIDASDGGAPVLADVDGDDDIDLVMGKSDGGLSYHRNTGLRQTPQFVTQTGTDNPFDDVADLSPGSAPALMDLDGDGDVDFVARGKDGRLIQYENTGMATAPLFEARSGAVDFLGGPEAGGHGSPSSGDIDGDGAPDLVVGNVDGKVRYYTRSLEETVIWTFDENGRKIGYTADTDASDDNVDADDDGVPDREGGAADKTVTWIFDESGERTGSVDREDTDSDGIVDRTVIRTFDANGRETGHTIDLGYRPVKSHPFIDFDVGKYSSPVLADIDGDGDLDLLTGARSGVLFHYENTGTATTPTFEERTGNANPFGQIDLTRHGMPELADIDGDGDLDLVAGRESGTLSYHENTGSAAAPTFEERTGDANPFADVDVVRNSAPALADLDGDGDLDLVAGRESDTLSYHENTGSAAAPAFKKRTGDADPFVGLVVRGDYGSPVLADLDGDGDLDLVVGNRSRDLSLYLNTGTKTAPAFEERTDGSAIFEHVDAGYFSKPEFADLNGDGFLDLLVGEKYGRLRYYEHPLKRTVTLTFDADGREIGYVEDTDEDGDADRTVTFTFDADGEKTGHVEDTDGDGDADRFEGDDRANALKGGAEADVLVGNGGADTLTGGEGADVFVLTSGDGADVVADFAVGSDRIKFDDGTVDSFEDLTIVASGNDASITYGDGGDTIILTGVSAAVLTADDFSFG